MLRLINNRISVLSMVRNLLILVQFHSSKVMFTFMHSSHPLLPIDSVSIVFEEERHRRRDPEEYDWKISNRSFAASWSDYRQQTLQADTESEWVVGQSSMPMRIPLVFLCLNFADQKYAWCLCGQSKGQPLCDGTHKYVHYRITLKYASRKCPSLFDWFQSLFSCILGLYIFKWKKMASTGCATANRRSIDHFVMELTSSQRFKKKLNIRWIIIWHARCQTWSHLKAAWDWCQKIEFCLEKYQNYGNKWIDKISLFGFCFIFISTCASFGWNERKRAIRNSIAKMTDYLYRSIILSLFYKYSK